ncbi:hypothetical protein [Nocardioides sp. 616]|uniref:hypothetical protein n=1 Tax=Nocardioides sp. 616 TaxID=2268090 RepID=UPI000CE4261E|nr:hypothetical protein [Nocardioides sp. 616]
MDAGRPPIFDEVVRTDASPSQHQESTFDFMNRIAGDYWQHPRSLMQEWLDRIENGTDYRDLCQRLRSRDDEQFRSAFLELYLHESLIRAGYAVTIHPVIDGTSTHPDFLAERQCERFYIEAIAPGSTPSAKAAAQRRSVLFDTVNRLDDPNFILWLDELVEGSTQPAAARLRADLRRWLRGLDPDAPWDHDSTPAHQWQHAGWSATFKAIPKDAEARGRRTNHRAIGVYGHTGVGWIDDAPAIRKALTSKHHEYGDLDAPFVIAVGMYIHDTDRWHTTNALYGALGVQWSEGPDGEVVTREVRQSDGYFGVASEWQHRNVSGVLLVNQLMPYYLQRAEVTLWRHPNPVHQLPDHLGLPAHVIALPADMLTETPPASTAEEFFGLPAHWPPGEPWPDEA